MSQTMESLTDGLNHAIGSIPTVEATSMSVFTDLAAHPPSDPEAFNPALPESLTLYIARVPGSRDVFLSPMKPRDRTVTAEDIQSSLYFLHVHGPEDEEKEIIRKSPSLEPVRTSNVSSSPPIPPPHGTAYSTQQTPVAQPTALPNLQNHPLPALPSPGLPQSLQHPPTLMPGMVRNQRPPALAIKRKPVGGATPPLSARSNFQNEYNIQSSRPSPKYSASTGPLSPPYPQQDMISFPENWAPHQRNTLSPLRSPLRNELSGDDLRSHTPRTESSSFSPFVPIQLPSQESPREGKSNHFTLIRRDPSTGEQWNIATVANHPSRRALDSTGTKFQTLSASVEVTIENPGYNRFTGSISAQSSSELSLHSPRKPSRVPFHRHIKQENLVLEDGKPGHRKALSQESIDFPPPGIYASDYRRGSIDFAASQVSLESETSQSRKIPRKGIKRSGYVFESPWNGRCEFSSNVGSSTLKCKHSMMPSCLSSDSAPPNLISELRFNLPGSAPPVNPQSSDNSPRRSKFFGHLHRRRSDESLAPASVYLRRGSEPNISASILDLSLGQERAGGGFSGKQAKLGKLIIQKEGLRMLDLLVAANLSLWWKAYEKGQ